MTDPSAHQAIAKAKSLERRMAEENRRTRPPITLAPVAFLNPSRPRPPVYDLDPDKPDLTVLLNDSIPY